MKIIVLGGGHHVGASCYYIQLDKAHIIFDCGIGFENGRPYSADYNSLYSNIDDLSQITHIFLSHGHLDHIGDVASLANMCPNAKIFSTELTKIFTRHQLWDIGVNNGRNISANQKAFEEMLISNALERISPVGYNEEYYDRDYKIKFTFYDAGHIPGAAMIYIKSPEKSVLYTGDFSYKRSGLVSGYCLPAGISADCVLLCGLYSCDYGKRHSGFAFRLESVINQIKSGEKTVLYTKQLTKGIEILKMLLIKRKEYNLDFSIAVNQNIYKLAEELEMCGIRIIEDGVFLAESPNGRFCNVSIVTDKWEADRIPITIDFSIHADYDEITDFISAVSPQKVFIVHVGRTENIDDNPIGAELFARGNITTEVTYLHDKEIFVV